MLYIEMLDMIISDAVYRILHIKVYGYLALYAKDSNISAVYTSYMYVL
jgi:hypothetical protein